MTKMCLYIVGNDPYNVESYRILSSRMNSSPAQFLLWVDDMKGMMKSDSKNYSWGRVLEIEFPIEAAGVPTITQSFYIPGKKKEYVEINKEAKSAPKELKVKAKSINEALNFFYDVAPEGAIAGIPAPIPQAIGQND